MMRLGSTRVLQRDKSGCKGPFFIYCEEGHWTAHWRNTQLCEYFSTSGEFKQDIIKGLLFAWGGGGVHFGSKTKKWKKRTHWTCGPRPGMGMEMGENMEEIHPNFLIMPCDKLMSEIWLLQGHCKPWLLNSLRSNPKLTLPFGGSIANNFLGKEGSGALSDHTANSSLLPGCAWKLSPGTKRLMW